MNYSKLRIQNLKLRINLPAADLSTEGGQDYNF